MDELNPRSGETGKFTVRHGMYGTRLYHIWNGLSGRCLNPNNKDYKNYGGRGISVCEEWRIPENFFDWAIANGYKEDLSLDRIDYDKGYSPNNCRWISNDAQQRNKRNNRVITFNGESHCLAEWAEITGIGRATISSRILYGWSIGEALTIKPSHSNNLHRRSGNE